MRSTFSACLASTGLLALVAIPSPAQAFCGTYVGSAGDLYNSASRVALTRFDDRTTITMANDVQGDTSGFAIVVPVPEIPGEDEVNVIDPEVFERLDGYSQPRLVSYECDDFYGDWDEGGGDGGGSDAAGDDGGGEDTGDVDVEARYIVGEYEVVILSAGESDALVTWLIDNGYNVSTKASELLQEYIDSGSYFFAAKVDADAEIESGDTLSPLQFSYEADVWALPVRLGTLNSPGSQDLVVYTLNSYEGGLAGISNYDQAEIEADCLWEAEGDEDFTSWYGGRLDNAHQATGANWVVEYSWGQLACDPCTGVAPDLADLIALGTPDGSGFADLWFTRLHLRYSPDEVSTALGLYQTGIQEQSQQRYIGHQEWLQEFFPVCDQGMVDVEHNECLDGVDDGEGSGSGDDGSSGSGDDDFLDDDADAKDGCGGCASAGASPGVALSVLALALVSMARRRE